MPSDPEQAAARRDHRLRCAAGDLAAGGTTIRADKALAFAQDIDALLAERDRLREFATIVHNTDPILASIAARAAATPESP
jgi:hypothetical protein